MLYSGKMVNIYAQMMGALTWWRHRMNTSLHNPIIGKLFPSTAERSAIVLIFAIHLGNFYVCIRVWKYLKTYRTNTFTMLSTFA